MCAQLLGPSGEAWAKGSDGLGEAIADLNASKGPDAYTAIRGIWAQWGATDPAAVEEALQQAAHSRLLPEPVRAYAAFLAAHARTRRGDIAGAQRAISSLGFINEWLVVGPFDNEGKAGFTIQHGPEAQFAEPIAEGLVFDGKARPVRWRQVPSVFRFGWLDGSSLFRPEQNICIFASSVVWREAERKQPVTIWAGAAGAFKLFVNGKQVLSDDAYRGHDVDRFGASVRLPSGKNLITVKACGADDAPIVSVRIGDAKGRPLDDLHVSSSFADASQAAANHDSVEIVDPRLGPLAAFEKLVSGKQPRASSLESYARYLVASGADDPAVHKARDLALRAARSSPNLDRLLLAGELAEDYNQHRQWVEKAEQLKPQSTQASVDVLLARARVERSGLNWRDAFPFYEQALTLAPDNLQAIQGRVELFNEAGMGRTALSILEDAVARTPRSVTLLNMYASQLRALGRIGDADEVERRYSQFRFDDHELLTRRMELALARGERDVAEHWIARLLATHPDSLWAQSISARAYRRLNQPQRALLAYEKALELAPEDVATLRSLSDLHGQLGNTDEQVALLRKIVEIQPQAKDVHEYLSNIEPAKPKQDEAYAWEPDAFLKDRNAPAKGENKRTLLDLKVVTVFDNGLSSQFRQVVFQPLVDSSAALSRNYYFSFEAGSQRVQLRGAKVYRADGRVDEAVETAIGAANDPSIAMYTSARTYSVQFPRLDPGDVVELRYRIDDVAKRNEFNDYFGDVQYMQDTETVGHSEYVLITPKSRKLYIDEHGVPNLKRRVAVKGNQRIYRFWADDLPPVHPEPAMPPWSEVVGFVHVSTYENYQELGKWYWGLAKEQFDLDEETRKLAREITKGLSTEREKVSAVYNWVIKNTRYVALEFGIYGFKPRRCVQTVARGWGDCKDKATVIVSLLEELGIDSTIVILRTQMRGGFESSVASLAPFDHAIAYVPSLDLYLDGTAEFTGSSELPAMDQRALGILVNQGKSKLVTLPFLDPKTNLRDRTIDVKVDSTGKAQLDVAVEVSGSQAPSWRRRYHAKATQRERATTDLGREFTGFALNQGQSGFAAELEDYERPVKIDMSGTSSAYGRVEGNNLSLPVTGRVRLTESYASLSARSQDVAVPVLGTLRDTFNVKLPAGYKVVSTPPQAHASTPFGDYSVEVRQKDGQVSVTSELSLKVTRVSPKDYRAWRAFCQAVDAAMTPRLVVGK